ncbi:PepSY domain-containing protein [Ferrimonas marina]|uniref:PepSY domain-containing protein n=1 Tax=Ferrimonas marina TaxID=299255 RepID=UPI0013566480|nr:2Fe-2S iron-sulfur cluster binding domain-containing protein [Ferrimonas marina]
MAKTLRAAWRLPRRLHRWLMILVGLQMAIWAISGSYFALTNIHSIHGDELVSLPQPTLDIAPQSAQTLLRDYPESTAISLSKVAEQWQYLVETPEGQRRLDASSGKPLPPISEAQAIRAALAAYRGEAAIQDVQLLDTEATDELSPRHLPVWRINFDDWRHTSLYISQATGELVSKRHDPWRWFDLLWRLHILDYDDGADINNPLLMIASGLALLALLAGVALLYRRQQQRYPGFGLPRWHRWLANLVGLQMLIWTSTGLYFSWVDHERLAGRQYWQAPSSSALPHGPLLEPSALPTQLPIRQLDLSLIDGEPVYQLVHHRALYPHFSQDLSLVHAQSGAPFVVDAERAQRIALASYRGPGSVIAVEWLQRSAERTREQDSLWRVQLDDDLSTRIYVSAVDGRLIGHNNRHTLEKHWMLKLHFMDYLGTGGFNHPLIWAFSLLSLLLVGSGIMMLTKLRPHRARDPERHRIVLGPNGTRTLVLAEGQNLLEALNEQGQPPPSDCDGTGQCGRCRVRLENPGVASKAEVHHLSEKQLAKGWRLACQQQ